MNESHLHSDGHDGQLFAYRWVLCMAGRAVVQIAQGASEHGPDIVVSPRR